VKREVYDGGEKIEVVMEDGEKGVYILKVVIEDLSETIIRKLILQD
jgi:hypothetical protein